MVKLSLTVLAVGIAVVSVVNPQLAERLGFDVWNLPALHAKCEAAEERERDMDASSEDVQHRIAVKETIIADLLAERCDLATATERFAELNASRPGHMDLIRATYPGDTDEEKLARNVISYSLRRVPAPDGPALATRLEAELNRMRSAH